MTLVTGDPSEVGPDTGPGRRRFFFAVVRAKLKIDEAPDCRCAAAKPR